jgi:hypothetical protein
VPVRQAGDVITSATFSIGKDRGAIRDILINEPEILQFLIFTIQFPVI